MDWNHLYINEKDYETPVILEAEVVHGFKRGSKELGIPTANLNMEELGSKGDDLQPGIYYGWAYLNGNKYQCVASIGWNPFYHNSKKTIEAHLLAKLEDFYGKRLKLDILGYLRAETNFNSLGIFFLNNFFKYKILSKHNSFKDELISCIQCDIDKCKAKLL